MNYYRRGFESIVTSLEAAYGLNAVTASFVQNSKLGIEELLTQALERQDGLTEKDSANLCIEAGPSLSVLSNYFLRTEFFGVRDLDFSLFAKHHLIKEVMRIYSSSATLNSDSREVASDLIEILQAFEEKNKEFMVDLEYRYLRMFLVMSIYRNFSGASIVAKLVMHNLR